MPKFVESSVIFKAIQSLAISINLLLFKFLLNFPRLLAIMLIFMLPGLEGIINDDESFLKEIKLIKK